MKYQIQHRTVYRYAEPVAHSVHELRLAPRSGPLQAVAAWGISVPGKLSETRDAYGNIVHHFTLAGPADTIQITARGEVEARPHATHASGVAAFHDARHQGEARVPALYFRGATALTSASSELAAFAGGFLDAGHTPDAMLALAGGIARAVAYRANVTTVHTTAAEAFGLGAGVCQDHAHVMLASCRAHGIPARYVSGYFYDPTATRLASHAWADVCLDVAADLWCSVDVTHGCLTDTRHVRLAVGRDYLGAAPIRGVRDGGAGETLSVNVEIKPVAD